jgi:hypothetical protein
MAHLGEAEGVTLLLSCKPRTGLVTFGEGKEEVHVHRYGVPGEAEVSPG